MSNKQKKSNILSNIIKWVLIIGLLVIAIIKNKAFFNDAINEIGDIDDTRIVICAFLANLYFVAEGLIISRMTSKEEHTLSLAQGISCAYMCAFYRVTTLGSGTGVAQLYYYNSKKISVSRATGMSMAQYTFMKMTVGILGVASFIALIFMGDKKLEEYWIYMLLGSVLISLVCIFLFIITVSKKISDWLIRLGYKLVKEKSRLYSKLATGEQAVKNLQECGRTLWHDKPLLIQVIILNVLKFACWYAIPGIIFTERFDVNIFMCMLLMAVCNMVGCVMIAPSGVGTLEFVVAMFFGTIIPEGDVIAATLVIYRFFTWIVPFVIGIIPALFLKKD